MITKITNHEEAALNRLLSQYREKSLFEGMITSFVEQIQDLEDAVFDMYNLFSINNSSGVQLDRIGAIVGQPRNGQTDEIYRLFLKGKAAKNISAGTINDIITVTSLLTDVDKSAGEIIQLFEIFPAAYFLQLNYYPSNIDEVFLLIQSASAAGVRLDYMNIIQLAENFGFLNSGIDTAGFSEVISQGQNTSVSAGKLIDSGATFQTDGATLDMIVYNDSDGTVADIVSVDSEIQITLNADIFTTFPKSYYINANVGGTLAYLGAY